MQGCLQQVKRVLGGGEGAANSSIPAKFASALERLRGLFAQLHEQGESEPNRQETGKDLKGRVVDVNAAGTKCDAGEEVGCDVSYGGAATDDPRPAGSWPESEQH